MKRISNDLSTSHFRQHAVLLHQSPIWPGFDDPAVLHHVNPVDIDHRAEAVGDQYTSDGQASQGGPDRVLSPVVEHAGRFVEQQHARLARQRAGHQQSLLLSAGQTGSALGKNRVHPHRQCFDVLVESNRARRFPDLMLGQRRLAGDDSVEAVRDELPVL